mgnify:CR=1 FL=1
MSEEKLYAIKNDVGKYFDCKYAKFLPLSESYCPVIVSEDNAKAFVNDYGGQVVTLVEEPEKVVLSKKQAEIVETAKMHLSPAAYISNNIGNSRPDEILLMKAYVNGYTVETEKKYRVLAPKSWWSDNNSPAYMWHDSDGISSVVNFDFDTDDDNLSFTQKQLEQYNLTSDLFKKKEVTDDDE